MATPCDIKSNKNRIAALAELRPDLEVLLTAQYGGNDCMTYVFEAHIDGKICQGIGPSKKKAKTMACEQVLIHLGLLEETTEPVPDVDDDRYIWEDFSADIIDRNCRLFYDFDAVLEMEVEVDPSSLKPLHEIQQEIQIRETAEWLQEAIPDVYSDEKFYMIGKNAVSVLSELYPNAEYELIRQSNKKSHPCFVYGVYVDREEFIGSGINKKLAKARAAREALKVLCNMEFGVAEDGMPIYEGDARIWQAYKKKIEEEAERQIFSESIKNPVTILHEFFPIVKYSYEDEPSLIDNNAMIFVCSAELEGQAFKGSGLNKKAAKSNAAATALESLEADGTLMAKRQKMEERKREREKTRAEKPKDIDDSKKFQSAVSKLDALYPLAAYQLVGEANLKNTVLTAFTMCVTVDDKDYIGVGKTKKVAKQEAAEKALKAIGRWEESDERAKKWAAYEHTMSGYSPDTLAGLIRRNEAPGDLMQLIQEEYMTSQTGWRGGRGRSGRGNLTDMVDMEMYLAEMLITLSSYFGWRGGYSNGDQGIYGRGPNLPGGVIPLMRDGGGIGEGGVVPLLGDGGAGNVMPLLDEQTLQKIKESQNEVGLLPAKRPRLYNQHSTQASDSVSTSSSNLEPNISANNNSQSGGTSHTNLQPSFRGNNSQSVGRINNPGNAQSGTKGNNVQQPGARMWKNNALNISHNGSGGFNQQPQSVGTVRTNLWMSQSDLNNKPPPSLQQINAQLNNSNPHNMNNKQQNTWNQQQPNMPQQPPIPNPAWTNIPNPNDPSAMNAVWGANQMQPWNQQQWNNTNWNQWNETWNNQMNWNWQTGQAAPQQLPQNNQQFGAYGSWPAQ